MGNAWSCCSSSEADSCHATSPPRTDGTSQPHKVSETPEPSSVPSIESIQKSVQDENTAERMDELIKMLDGVLPRIKGKGEGASTSSRLQSFASTTRSASHVLDYVSKEAQKFNNLEIISQELGIVARSLLNAIGGTHFIFIGLSIVTYTVERYLMKSTNEKASMELLEELIYLAKEVKKSEEAVHWESEKLRKAILEIVVGAVTFCDYIEKGGASRFWAIVGIESQLQKAKERIRDVRETVTLTVANYIAESARQIAKRFVPSPSELLDFQPEGIEDQVKEVAELLDMRGSEQAIAAVIVGFGGIGKSTLAASVIQSLGLSSTEFKFSMVTIDQKTHDKTSHILKLQSDIIFHLTGDVLSLKDTQQGRQKLQAAMAGKSSFLYVDNFVDSYYIKELLPGELLTENPSKEEFELEELEKSAENSHDQMQRTKIRILVTSRQNDLKPLVHIKKFAHHVRLLSSHAAEKLLTRTILQGDNLAHNFDEKRMIIELAEACKSVPLLLSVFGNHLKDAREEDSYSNAIQALKEGILDGYDIGDENILSKKIMFVYDQMRDEEAEKAFIDICTYFHGWEWNIVSLIVDSATLATLHNKKLVNKSETSTVIVHDILRLMGAEKAKNTRLTNYEDFSDIKDDESKLRNVEGMVLVDPTFLATLELRHLNAMRHCLRVLVLGDCVRVDELPSGEAFKKLRYLEVGDLKDFPFKDVPKMEKLKFLCNSSKPGMELAELPLGLKYLRHEILHPDCTEFARLPLKKLKSLKHFHVQTGRSIRLPQGLTLPASVDHLRLNKYERKSVQLPQGFRLPASVEHLRLNSCQQLPETLGYPSALQTVSLDYCDLKSLPKGFIQSVHLRHLSLRHCTNMISLPDSMFASLPSLRDLDLTRCTSLEKLPADLGKLTALQDLKIGECHNLRELTASFGGLKSLKTLALERCESLQRLPDSFGMLRIEHLTLKFVDSLEELPQSIGDLSCLQSLTIRHCRSLRSVPDSLVQLTTLYTFVVMGCDKLEALPNNFQQLRSLKEIVLYALPRLRSLPQGFEALKSLKCMKLGDCGVQDLPTFQMLSCLEELYLVWEEFNGFDIFFWSLPDRFGSLKKLRTLWIHNCLECKTLPQDFENLPVLELRLVSCAELEGRTMDRVIKLQNCYYVDIHRSRKLIERWNELKEENRHIPMIVRTSPHLDGQGFHIGTSEATQTEDKEEMDRATIVGLVCGKCIELDSTTNEMNQHSSMSIPNNTTIAVISLRLDQPQIFQPIVDMAKGRARSDRADEWRIIYVCRRSDDSDARNEEEETAKIRQTLMMLPEGISYAIPSTDIRRLSLIGRAIFGNANVFNGVTGPKFLCYMLNFYKDHQGRQCLRYDGPVTEDEISKKSSQKLPISEISDEEMENSDEQMEISDGIVEFINCISDGSCSCPPEENMVGQFIQKLKNNNIDHFSGKVKVDDLQGKTVAIILIDQNNPERIRLQQIYVDIKLKHSNFEAVWIPLPKEEDFGFGAYSRASESMPWLTLADPKLIKLHDIKDKSSRIIIINTEGSIGNPNALPLVMSCGAAAYPFTKGLLNQLDFKSSLEILFHSTELNNKLNDKLIFLYAEHPDKHPDGITVKRVLETLVQIYKEGNFEIVYVGCSFMWREDEKTFGKAMVDATKNMNWIKLSNGDMTTFWDRCKWLLSKEKPQSPSIISSLVDAVSIRPTSLVVLDGDGMVTANGLDLVVTACISRDDHDEVDIAMKKELSESLKEGKCREVVRRYFRDEIIHPQHPHPLRTWKSRRMPSGCAISCNGCDPTTVKPRDYNWFGKRTYGCDECFWWNLCWDCWNKFVKEEVTRHADASQQS